MENSISEQFIEDFENENQCIICDKKADHTGSHIIPANLIKDCIGIRHKEESYNIDLLNGNQLLYIGTSLQHRSLEINKKKLEITKTNPYILDYILCTNCEKKLGIIEGEVYTEIICKIRLEKFKNNFKKIKDNWVEVLIPLSSKMTTEILNIYFYSIILRHYYFNVLNKIEQVIDLTDIILISKMLDNLLNNESHDISNLNTGLFVCVTDDQKKFPAKLITNMFENAIIPVCHFFIIVDSGKKKTPFGNGINLINDKEFKFIKNSSLLDSQLLIENIFK